MATLAGYMPPGRAAVSIMRPPREARSDEPLVVTIVYTGDTPSGTSVDVPRTLSITLTNGEQLPRSVLLAREPGAPEHIRLAAGEMKVVSYHAPWPEWARGAVRVDVPGVDVSPSLVLLTRKPRSATASAGAPEPAPATAPAAPVAAVSAPLATAPAEEGPMAGNESLAAQMPPSSVKPSNSLVPDLGAFLLGRFSFYEPTYFADGWASNGEDLAKFQISFKFRFVLPDDPRSRGFVDNLYFAYTQTSLWDIRKYSAPFRDTSYKPALFYYLADTGWRTGWFSRMGIETGYEHESNGRDGPESRGVDILYVKPVWDFGDLNANHLTVAPKVYWYEHIAGENSDIADYRGYVDLLVKYGSPDGWQLATTLRKGTKSTYGSVDAQFTYPLAKLFGNAWGGYLWVGYFNGYGEDILDYNQHRWAARIGFSMSR
ncbi:phospholipase A [Paraburkholderia lycopersici]|uniref:Phospholipase A1 n=1 Tax=Paraburkholderia lycopersici TaxID=416944 RepID=A0A1G6PZ66_9BURK|nr:phospholipase A [Paraburkholderia lycopersici]SDC85368.1 Outer membrane phospholipase A [Paraburkholderia lycopersici]